MEEIKLSQIPQELAHKRAVIALGGMCDAILKAMVDKFGSEEALKMIEPYLRKQGKAIGKRVIEKGISSRDAIALAQQVHAAESQLILVEGEIKEASSEEVKKQITKCPLQHLSVEFCKSFGALMNGMAEEVSPEYEWVLTKIIPAGDSICEWVIRKKQ